MGRIAEIMNKLSDKKQAALITSDVSRRYLSGFKSSAGILLITKEKSYLLIDFRYFDKAKQEASEDCEVVLLTNTREQLMELYINHGISEVFLENNFVTLAQLAKYKDEYAFLQFDTSSFLSDMILDMRIIKDKEELKYIVTAQRIAEKAYQRLLNDIKVGMTEKHVAALLDYYMAEYGSDGLSFDTIAASGINSASPHAVPTDKKLQAKEFLTLDFGATYKGYHSDMTRTIAIGGATDEMRTVYSAVFSANNDAIKAVRAGVGGKVPDSVARSTLDAWGYAEYFGHGLGHGVGLEIHEAPTSSRSSVHTLKKGMILTIEPGVYISGKFGVRIEDMVCVTEDGCVNLTNTTKALTII